MMKNKVFAVMLALLVLGLLQAATPSPTYACSCGGPSTAKQAMESSDVVFLGKVISVKDTQPTVTTSPPSGIEVRFEVLTIWKGEPRVQHVVYTGSGGGDCGVEFTLGETTVVFASELDNQSLFTGSCSYWRPDGVPPDEVALSAGTPIPTQISSAQDTTHVEAVKDASSPEQPSVPTSFILPVAGLIALASVAALIIRRRSA